VKIAYLILAHDNPGHLGLLVEALLSDRSSVFVHIDQKSDLNKFSKIKNQNVFFIKDRISVYWGDFSQVDAILILMREALAYPFDFDRFVLLSGTDYPLRSCPYIEHFFECNPHAEFMDLVQMPSVAAGKSITRLTHYNYRPSTANSLLTKLALKTLKRIGIYHKRDYKKYLGHLVPYAGATWWALSEKACRFIMAFVEREVSIVNFFKNTYCPDEMFFQTILGNSNFSEKIRQNLTYTDWSAGGARPACINEKHLAFFSLTFTSALDDLQCIHGMLFARKFSDERANLVASLLEIIKEKDSHSLIGVPHKMHSKQTQRLFGSE
jgi:hypothetical protein